MVISDPHNYSEAKRKDNPSLIKPNSRNLENQYTLVDAHRATWKQSYAKWKTFYRIVVFEQQSKMYKSRNRND